jgi:hypothetical protein
MYKIVLDGDRVTFIASFRAISFAAAASRLLNCESLRERRPSFSEGGLFSASSSMLAE